jgi:hypothetical protein
LTVERFVRTIRFVSNVSVERWFRFGCPLITVPEVFFLLSPTFMVSPPMLRTEAIGGRQACGLAQVSEKKNQPEGLNAQADQVYPG